MLRLLLMQVANCYVHLVTSINNADTIVTLIVPSVMIIFCNFRISLALSQFYRGRHLTSAAQDNQRRAAERNVGDAAAAAECDVTCVTREQSVTARTASPAADRLSACPAADQLCRVFGVVLVE